MPTFTLLNFVVNQVKMTFCQLLSSISQSFRACLHSPHTWRKALGMSEEFNPDLQTVFKTAGIWVYTDIITVFRLQSKSYVDSIELSTSMRMECVLLHVTLSLWIDDLPPTISNHNSSIFCPC